MSLSPFNKYPTLTPVRLVKTTNLSGSYFNGLSNNGVGATFTVAASSLTIDSVVCVVGDRVLLEDQTNDNENGIYQVTSIGSTVVLTRASDMQCSEQLMTGQYVSVSAGTVNAGALYTVVEPLPATFGVDDLVFTAAITAGLGTAATKAASDNGEPSVASVSGATTANALAVFADTAGTVKAATTTTTLGQSLAVTGSVTASTSITATAGNITSGSSGDAGTFIAFPATAANGTMILAAGNAGGAFNTTITSGTIGQSTVYTIPDILASTGGIVVSTAAVRMKSVAGAAAAGGAAAQSFTDTFCTTGSNVVGNWNTQANAVSVLKIVPGNGSFVVTSSGDAGVGTFNYIITK